MSNTKAFLNIFAAVGFVAVTTGPSLAFDDGDPVKGESIFKKCSACHMVGPEAKNRVGPVLTGVFGRSAGVVEDYKYGKDIIAAGEAGLVWTEEELFEYLSDPKKYLRAKLDNKKAKSKMSFKLRKEEERKHVIAYLKTFSPEAEGEAEDAAAEEEAATTN
ncbi:MAG: cytochrome c family protein [Pseudomonadota bacterium]